MSQPPFEQIGNLRIGTVDFVSPDKIEVSLDITAPESVALNTGIPRPFPRVNDYLLIPVDESFLTGQVEWLTVEDSSFPKRSGMRDFGLIDLPYPLRKLRLNPLGTLRIQSGSDSFIFGRGADALPSVGEAVLLPSDDQLRAIVESGKENRIKVGSSLIAANANVYVDPNRLFGRHLAVLGNTGSGKSCSVAGLIRWSLEEAQDEKSCIDTSSNQSTESDHMNHINARFIVLDPNGEYSRAFGGRDSTIQARVFKVDPDLAKGEVPLKVPLWFWNSAEWFSFTQASARAQRPVLMHALSFVRGGHTQPSEDSDHEMRRFLRTLVSTIRIEQNSGSPWGSFPKPKSFFEKIYKWKIALESEVNSFTDNKYDTLQTLINKLNELCAPRQIPYPDYDFRLQEVRELLKLTSDAHTSFGGTMSDIDSADVDSPRPFEMKSLLRSVEAAGEMLDVSQYIETLLMRMRALLTDARITPIIDSTTDISLDGWLRDYIGDADSEGGNVSVIDLSLVPTEVVHIITAVIARMVFEALQRYVKLNGVALPTVLVMEEAHTFIKRYRYDTENLDAEIVCCQVFERIAREGRKFGLGLVLSSQRPSELSPAVLSQCNTFLLHQLSNDRDQELVHRLVPDNLRGLLRELPSLPSQSAILLGWASELPVLVKMNDLPRSQQPRSDDPEFWKVWTGEEIREINWDAIVEDWTGSAKVETETQAEVDELEYPETESDEDDLLW